ncbi:MAG TPA: acyl-ACP--UDP-N-acetylglucosamine O-acyltransferase [Alphaproteobacteria bacterium]|nr:acyl-ACP--UDP-N-acetylglucosamine O-acyltransferase [Candidatus Binataceae bacterium]HUN29096.1 acyl-ACP--UDP-N-acetylglucosamine O-acyltransferase [Alphaproteobacteria bacterium]
MIHPTAIVHPNANIARGVDIGPFCLVGENVSIGKGTVLQAHVVINGWTSIGEDCEIYPFATIGASSQDRKYTGERAFTKIGNRTVLREYVSVQRATGEDQATAVGDDCLLLAYVHIAHNCVLGNHVTMSNLAQLAGHVEVGDFVTIGGQAGVHQFTRIGRYAMVGGASKITKDVPPFFLIEGNPAEPYGLNSVGLRRAGFTVEERNEIKKFYKILYNPKLNVSQAVEEMKAEASSDPGRELVAFLEAPSQRGILK